MTPYWYQNGAQNEWNKFDFEKREVMVNFLCQGVWKSGMDWPPRFLGDFKLNRLIGYQKFRKNSYLILFPKTCLKTLTVRIFDIHY